MISAVRIRNLRSLADTGFIEIKPITILLGANSSGKSTFLRSFPLLKQSVSKSLRGPISWFDDSLVDFGDYNTALNKFADENATIQFDFIIQKPIKGPIWGRSYRRYFNYGLIRNVNEIKVSFSLKNDNKGTFINSLCFIIDGLNIKMEIPDRQGRVKFEVNDQMIDIEHTIRWDARSFDNIFPSFDVSVKDSKTHIGRMPISEVLHDNIFKFVRKRSDKRLKTFSRVDIFVEAWTNDKSFYLKWLKEHSPITSFRNYINKWDINNPEFIELFNLVALESLLPLWDLLDSELYMFYRNCSYIAPTRAEANRYYRTQGLQVSDIDPYGKNLPEFISSLTTAMTQSYNNYTKDVLGVLVRTKTEAGHQCIMVSNDKGEFNITDIGFGYSQILPIITKLWYASNYYRFRSTSSIRDEYDNTILMEQPELHLHPAYQAKIADALISAVNKNENSYEYGSQLRLIAETHSETILNRIGRRVREKVISPDDVNIIIFNKGLGDKLSTIRQTSYNSKGQIMEWPYGFFDPEQN